MELRKLGIVSMHFYLRSVNLKLRFIKPSASVNDHRIFRYKFVFVVISSAYADAFQNVERKLHPQHFPGCQFLQHKFIMTPPSTINALDSTIPITKGK